MTTGTDTLSIADAISNLRTCARDLRDPDDLNEVAEALGAHIRWYGRPTRDFPRAVIAEGCEDLPSVSVAAAACELAQEIVPGFTDPGSKYHGRGRNAQYRADVACDALARHFDVEAFGEGPS